MTGQTSVNRAAPFLPTTKKEMECLGIKELDVIIVTADAYVDHPAFGAAIIGRFLESLGLTVGVIAQPKTSKDTDFMAMGRPKLFFGVTAGNLDSMVALYTAQRKIRSDDPYSENGKAGNKPYLPSIIYTNSLQRLFKGVPVIIGGIEASLRRVAHYDFYTDKVRSSILLDSKADLLVYGNAESALEEIVSSLKNGKQIKALRDIKGTVCAINSPDSDTVNAQSLLPSFDEVKNDKTLFSIMTRKLLENMNPYSAKALYQKSGSRWIKINPPAIPLTTAQLDRIYSLPFIRKPHPGYKGDIPAFTMIANSITSHRGCYGGCNFCAIYFHQGKFIQSRSFESICREADKIASHSGGFAVITDIGGPTANMYGTSCGNESKMRSCTRKSCLYPEPCLNLFFSQKKYVVVLENIRHRPGIKNVFVNSGIRYDLALLDRESTALFFREFVQGQLSSAPEHVDPVVLRVMGKPACDKYGEFNLFFEEENARNKKKQFIMPYFIVGHPGSDERTETALSEYIKKNGIKMDQIQEFYPTPMTVASSVYYTGIDPVSGSEVKSEKKLSIKRQWKMNCVN